MTTKELIILILLAIIILEAAFLFIYGYICDKKEIEEIKKFVEGIKVGEKYTYWIPSYSNNPFDEDYIIEVKIQEIRKNSSGEIWIKFITEDGETGIESGKEFYNNVKNGK